MIQQIAKKEWKPLRTGVTADDTALTTFEYSNATYVAGKVDIPDDINSIVIAAWGKDTNNDYADYILYGRRRNGGPIEKLATGRMTLGAQAVTNDPLTGAAVTAFWVDTITNTADWIKTTVAKNSGNDGICYLCLDTFGLKDVYLEIDIPASTPMTEFNAIISGAV